MMASQAVEEDHGPDICTSHEMALRSRTVPEFLTDLCWGMLAYTPRSLKNPCFDQVFSSPQVIKKALSPLRFANGLLDAVQSTAPPTISFFQCLPTNLRARWGVYVIVFTKHNCRPKVYFGSGTSHKGGVKKRRGQYRRRETLPFYVKEAFDEGFSLAHFGLLCWSPIPKLTHAASLRGLFILLESAFTLWFWPIKSSTKEYGMPPICPWNTTTLEYDGCCNHFPLVEGSWGLRFDLTPEQAIAVLAERRRKKRAWFFTQDPAYVRVRDNGPKRRRRLEKLASKKWTCDTCGLVFAGAWLKRKHEATQAHRNRVAGVIKKPSVRHIRWARNRATKRYYCQACDYAFADLHTLADHCKSKSHLLKVEATPGFVAPDLTRHKGLTTAERVAKRKIVIQEYIASKKYYCQTCDLASSSQRDLDRHLKTQVHLDKVAGIVRVKKDPKRSERAAQYLAERRYVCDPCNYAASSSQNLARHLSTNQHKKRMAELGQQLD